MFNILYITQIYNNSPLLVQLSANDGRNVWIFAIVTEEYIIADSAADETCLNKKRFCIGTISIYLTCKNISISYNKQGIQYTFDQPIFFWLICIIHTETNITIWHWKVSQWTP